MQYIIARYVSVVVVFSFNFIKVIVKILFVIMSCKLKITSDK